MIRRLAALSFVLVPACSGGGGSSGPAGEHHHYVVSSIALPIDSTTSNAYGADLDGDATIDNQLGAVLAALASGAAIDFNAYAAETVARGDVLLLADLQASALDDAGNAGFTLFRGANPSPAPCLDASDLVCGRHLTGSGSFDIEVGSRTDARVIGEIDGGAFATSSPGELLVSLPIGAESVDLTLELGRVEITTVSAGSLQSGTIAGAISGAEVGSAFIPALHGMIQEIITQDCTGGAPPACGCMANSSGESLLSLFDENTDCAVPLAELEASATLASLLAPDVDTDADGTSDSLSLGIGFTAVGATFTQP